MEPVRQISLARYKEGLDKTIELLIRLDRAELGGGVNDEALVVFR
jgi:hypothetical protein